MSELDHADQTEIRRATFAHCTRFLGSQHGFPNPHAALAELARETPPELDRDLYGQGTLIEDFECDLAQLLGKQAALFFPSGTMAQQIALRIWSQRKGRTTVALHPLCHPALHELDAVEQLHDLRMRLVGDSRQLLSLSDLRAYEHVAEPLAALLIELPQRELGGQLPAWEDLQAQTEWARARGAAVHLDGARLWECAPFYGRSYAEIAASFDSVYVSFYKGVGALAGAALAAPADVIAEARAWRWRHGGTIIHLFPYVLSARLNLQRHLPRFGHYHERAKQIAAVLRDIPGIVLKPDPPHTHMMHVYLHGDKERMLEASYAIAREDGVYVFQKLAATDVPGYWRFEIQVGDAADALTDDEIHAYFSRILAAE